MTGAETFRAALAQGGKHAVAARQTIGLAILRCDPQLREAVNEDCRAIAKAAFQARGFADLSDLTRAGYAQDFALHQSEIIAAHRRSDARRTAA